MAEKAGVLPPRDLLQQVEGVEAGLRKNKELSVAGWVGVLLSLLEVAPAAYGVASGDATPSSLDALLIGAFPVLAGTTLFLVGRSRLWHTESREPFRYTCLVTAFKPLDEPANKEFRRLSDWLRFDLSERLNERIGRLAFLDDEGVDGKGTSGGRDAWSSHINVSGEYLVRGNDDQRVIEVTPRIRIGEPGSPAALAYPAKFEITGPASAASRGKMLDTRSTDQTEDRDSEPRLGLDEGDYDKLLERVYFSVATQIYRQIRKDVQRKIGLLPTRFLKATAYFFEAQDYVRSNTLDAYDEALELYEAAMKLYDPRLRPRPVRRRYRLLLWFLQWKADRTWPLRRRAAPVLAAPGPPGGDGRPSRDRLRQRPAVPPHPGRNVRAPPQSHLRGPSRGDACAQETGQRTGGRAGPAGGVLPGPRDARPRLVSAGGYAKGAQQPT